MFIATVEDLVETLEDLIIQFAPRGVKNGKPLVWTGGYSALRRAFKNMGWDDPHYLPEQGYTCEIVGCMKQDTCGVRWGEGGPYLRLCSKHYQEASAEQNFPGEYPCPPVKQWALDREAKRRSDGTLPMEEAYEKPQD